MQPTRYSPPPTATSTSSGRSFTDRFYRHSGKAPIGGLILILMLGGAAATIGAALYVLARVYIPYDIVNILMNLLFGLLIGGVASQAALWGKVRNPLAAAAAGLITGVLGLYAAWVFWIYARTEGVIVLSPVEMFTFMRSVAEQGDWSVRDITPKGIWLFLIWLAEAVIILGCASALPHTRVKGIPFCERTGAWLTEVTRIGPFAIPPDMEAMSRQLENGDVAILKNLRPVTITHPEMYLEIQLRASTMLHLLSVKQVTVATQNGQTVKKERPLVNHLIVDASAWDAARALQPAMEPLAPKD